MVSDVLRLLLNAEQSSAEHTVSVAERVKQQYLSTRLEQ